MGTYNSAVITNGGQSMIAQAVAGASLEFTTIKTSSYAYPAGTNLATLTTINGIKQSKDITGAAVYNSRVIKISADVDNTGISTAYAINTIGIYAKVGSAAESLFAVVTASAADTMPAYSNKPYSYIYEINLTMQNAANVTVTVNAAGLVNVADLNAAKVEIRGEIADLKSALTGESLDNNEIIFYDETFHLAGTSNWPERTFIGRLSKWNGTFGTGAANYFLDLLNPGYYGSSYTYIQNNFLDFASLIAGHTYKISSYILSGSVAAENGIAEIWLYKNVRVPIDDTVTFTYNGETSKFVMHFTQGVTLTNAYIYITVHDITNIDGVKDAIDTGATRKKLSAYKWAQGKHVNRNGSIESPSSATNTVALIGSIPYDYNMYFVVKTGWTAAFVSVENSIVTGLSRSYLPAGRINMIDVFNNLAYTSVSYFGDSLSINLRRTDSANFDITDINIDDVIEMFVVNKKTNPCGESTWVAIGDSITDGRYSQSDGGTVRSKTNHYSQYGYIASKIMGVDNYVEQGYGGMGYVHVANDGTYLTDVLALDLGNPDIITVCLGVNDRSQTLGDENSAANDGTISGAIRNCCEILGTTYPNAHIIFMTPINATATGSASTGWCKRSGTTHLEDIAGMIKYWAGLYGFPVIDMLNECPINDFNIQTMILDQLHPTMEAHYMVGKYLAGVLPYKIT